MTIAELNDKFRQNFHNGLGRFVITRSVMDKGPDFVAKCVQAGFYSARSGTKPPLQWPTFPPPRTS